MACVLYKEGNSGKEFGIPCDMVRVDPAAVQRHLDVGYVLDPRELYGEGGAKGDEEDELHRILDEQAAECRRVNAEKQDQAELKVRGLLSKSAEANSRIRDMAKEAGIKGWQKSRIKTLKAALEDGSSEE